MASWLRDVPDAALIGRALIGYPALDFDSKPAAGPPKFPALEADVLDYWDSDDTFRASVARRDGSPEYVFYD